MVLGSLTLAVLPACSPGEATTAPTDTAATESVSSTTSGDEGERPESSSSSTDESAADDERDATGSATTDEGGDDSDTSTAADEGSTQLHRVIRVVDGDTVKVDIFGGESVRVIGIDTPETVHPDKPVECGGPEASAVAEEMLEGKSVAVVFDESQGRRDKYGRLLAYLDIPGVGDFGEEMLRGGHAEEYTYDTAYARQSTYRSVEQQARNTGHGLWSGCSQQPEPAAAPSSASAAEPTTQAPAPEPITEAPVPEPAVPAAPGPAAQGWTNDSLTPGYTGCRQGYPGGRVSGVYWWKPIAC